jgi:hypothetical protein
MFQDTYNDVLCNYTFLGYTQPRPSVARLRLSPLAHMPGWAHANTESWTYEFHHRTMPVAANFFGGGFAGMTASAVTYVGTLSCSQRLLYTGSTLCGFWMRVSHALLTRSHTPFPAGTHLIQFEHGKPGSFTAMDSSILSGPHYETRCVNPHSDLLSSLWP